MIRASVWVTAGMLAGRLAGILREFLIAQTFGVSRSADVAILLVTAPDVLVTLAGSGAIGLVLIPILLEHDVKAQLGLVRRIARRLGMVAIALAAVTAALVLLLGTEWATQSDVSVSTFRLAVVVTAFALPPSMVVVLTAAFLRAQDRFAVVSFATVTFTVPLLLAIVLWRSVLGVAIGIAAGALLRYLAQELVIRTRWPSPRSSTLVDAPLRATDVGAAFAVSVLLAAQVSLPLLLIAVVGDAGDVALLNYGWRVLLIPIGLIGSIFSVAAYPTIVRVLQDDTGQSAHSLRRITQPVILSSVAIGVWLGTNATSAIEAVYRPAGLEVADLGEVATGIRAGAASIPLLAVGTAATSVSFGLKRSRIGLLPYSFATVILLIGGLILGASRGASGVMYAISLYALALSVTATLMLHRSTGFAVVDHRSLVAVAATSAGAALLAAAIRELVPGSTLLEVAANGVLFVLACGVTYFAWTRLRRVE